MDKPVKFRLVNKQVKEYAIEFIRNLPAFNEYPFVIEIKPETRSMAQNSKFHAMLQDVSEQCFWNNKKYDVYGWKNLLVSGHTIATGLPYELVNGIENELVNVREQTSKMTIKRMNSLIEYTQAWATGQGVKFKTTEKWWW
ncbi:recombination protein NinB [Gallibacterium anatis]|uniref:recombination protein NinB n=1 Tax=Gallibacterium anatis TaxID=750 RepID=UPI000531D33F|nr:recombination protein NinB [Gallibacterium anatis]KGQ44488.1 recombinase [Gallibacterium anatis]